MTPPPAAKPDPSKGVPDLTLVIQPLKSIYNQREGIGVQFVLKAAKPIKLCLEKDPFTQFQIQIKRGGIGLLPLDPMVTEDTRELFFEKLRIVELKPGDSFPIRANLKRLQLSKGEKWAPGDYYVSATFNLCDQAEGAANDSSGKEIPIKSTKTGNFMIME